MLSQIGLSPKYHNSHFNKPPFSSRTVGFPESGWWPWPFVTQPSCRVYGFKCLLTYTHSSLSLLHTSTCLFTSLPFEALCLHGFSGCRSTMCQKLLHHLRGVTSSKEWLINTATLHWSYPMFIATTSLCAKLIISNRLTAMLSDPSLQVAASPC